MTAAVRLRNLHMKYGDNPVLKGLSLELEQGKFHTLIGHNGVGKSTLMRVMMRHEVPDQGEGEILGIPLERDTAEFNRRVSFASESVTPPIAGTIRQGYELISPMYPAWDRDKLVSLAGEFGVDLDKPVHALSRGQRMQALACGILAAGTSLLLLDEITAVLDAAARTILVRELGEFRDRGGTVLLATNLVTEASPIADTVVFLGKTGVELQGSVDEISRRFVTLRQKRGDDHPIFREPDVVLARTAEDGSLIYIASAELTGRFGQLGACLYRSSATVEDIFVYLTKRREAPVEPQ